MVKARIYPDGNSSICASFNFGSKKIERALSLFKVGINARITLSFYGNRALLTLTVRSSQL